MNQTNQTKQEDESKEIDKNIGGYHFKLKTSFNQTKDDYVILTLIASQELKGFLSRFCLKDEDLKSENITITSNYGTAPQIIPIKRYLVKSAILNSLPITTKGLLFEKTFIESGVLTLKILTFNAIDTILGEFRIGLKALIETNNKYNNIEVLTSFKRGD